MSQSPDFDLELVERPSNPIGLVGFILAFCISPIGLILSLVGLAKRPRGFAIAGVFIGLIGTAVWATVGFGLFKLGQMGIKMGEVTKSAIHIQDALAEAKKADGKYPATLAAANVKPADLNDPWGNPYAYEVMPDGTNYIITSAGADGQKGTSDDVEFDRFIDEGTLMLSVSTGFISWFGTEAESGVKCGRDLHRLEAAVDDFEKTHAKRPATLAEIPGLLPPMLIDPWGTPYRLTLGKDDMAFEVTSDGPDKKQGTRDDIDVNQINVNSPGLRQKMKQK